MPPNLRTLNLWKRHQERVCDVLAHALNLLQNRPGLIQDEDNLNRELSFCLQEANAYLHYVGRGIDTPIFYEARNQPSGRHQIKHLREDKRPDFLCGFVDHSERDPRKQNKFFCIECKRLGDPPSSRWILNANYVNNGIVRFIEESHGYAIEVESGAMVGYVESSDFSLILQEVNLALAAIQPTLPSMQANGIVWNSTDCNFLENMFERSFPVSPFTLKHFWIDLRGRLTSPPPMPPKAKKTKKNTAANGTVDKGKVKSSRKR